MSKVQVKVLRGCGCRGDTLKAGDKPFIEQGDAKLLARMGKVEILDAPRETAVADGDRETATSGKGKTDKSAATSGKGKQTSVKEEAAQDKK